MEGSLIAYRSPVRLATVTTAFLCLQSLCAALLVTVNAVTFGHAPTDDITPSEAIMYLVAGAAIIAAVCCGIGIIISFCLWFYRIQRNLRALGAHDLTRSAGWAVGSFFVPFVNLVVPYQAAQEAWKASDPDVPQDSGDWKVGDASFLIQLWWGCWIIGSMIGRGANRLSATAETPAALREADAFAILAGVLWISAAALCIGVVQRMTRRQERKAQAIQEQPAAFL